ncbi:hypothetical protein CEXT_242401, partial [Caerostris extrusa]
MKKLKNRYNGQVSR